MRLRDDWLREQKSQQPPEELIPVVDDTPPTPQQRKKRNLSKGVVVKGIDNCLVNLAGCCNPVPGDEIIGFITKGRGVSVHRTDCPNIRRENMSEEDINRLIEVSWGNAGTSYLTNIQIETPDRPGVLMEILAILADLNILCKSVNTTVNKKEILYLQLGIEIKDTGDIAKLTKKVKQLPNIISVTRLAN